VLLAVVAIGDARLLFGNTMQRDDLCLVDGRGARRLPRLHEIARHFGLTVNRDRAAHQRFEIDAMMLAVSGELHTRMRERFGVQTLDDTGRSKNIDATLFEHARADTAEHVLSGASLENDVVDSSIVQ